MKTPIKQASEAERRGGMPVNAPNARMGDGSDPKQNTTTGAEDALVGALPVFDVMPANSGRFTFSQPFELLPP